MTPTKLQALLDREGVPMEARAELLIDAGVWFCPENDLDVHDDIAELAHVGAMVKWLAEESTKRYPRGNSIRPRGIRIYAPDIYVDGWNVSPNGAWDTLTEALAHACGQIAKESA